MIEVKSLNILVEENADNLTLKTVNVFCEELRKRSDIDISENNDSCAVSVGFYTYTVIPSRIKKIVGDIAPIGEEGFQIKFVRDGQKLLILVIGSDSRGTFYGMGMILRKSRIKKYSILIPESLDGFVRVPERRMRGHQLGYRDKQNTLPTWTVAQFETYIRELALFGANQIELIVPISDDMLYSPHYKVDPYVMMVELSKISHSYGLEVWLWVPNIGDGFSDEKIMKAQMEEREKVFKMVPYVDYMLVPFGDPGTLPVAEALSSTEQFANILHKHHPDAKVWITSQNFSPDNDWYEYLYRELAKEPDWLYGVSYAPWEKDEIQELHRRLPDKYKKTIRHYVDITHNTDCELPVPFWDDAFALTIGREGVNIRPRGMKFLHNYHAPYTMGSVTYSEGVHDDINKFIWTDQDISMDIPVEETVGDYIRFFIGEEYEEELSKLVFDVEKAWEGPVAENKYIESNYEKLVAIDKKVPESVKSCFRYQLIKLRVLSDLYTKSKRKDDLDIEKRAIAALAEVDAIGSIAAIKESGSIFNEGVNYQKTEWLLNEIQRMSDDLYASIGIRLTVSHNGCQAWIRGGFIETLRMPLNDYQYYMRSFKAILELSDENKRRSEIKKLLTRTQPADGYYYNLGSYDCYEKNVVHYRSYEEDPSFMRTPSMDHSIYRLVDVFHNMENWYTEFPMPFSWTTNAEVLYGTPLVARFDGLDPSAEYVIRVIYPVMVYSIYMAKGKIPSPLSADVWAGNVKLASEIPPIQLSSDMYWEYEIPAGVISSEGVLEMKWQVTELLQRFGVSDVWIIKK